MRPLILLFLLAICARTQTTFRVYPQPVHVGGLTQYLVSACNTGPTTLNVQAAQIWAAAYMSGVQPATHENVLAEAGRVRGMSWQRKALLSLEILSYLTTLTVTTDLIKINTDTARGKALASAIPAIGVSIRTATTLIEQQTPTFTMPEQARLLPNLFLLPTAACADYLMYGSPIP